MYDKKEKSRKMNLSTWMLHSRTLDRNPDVTKNVVSSHLILLEQYTLDVVSPI